MRSVPLLVAVFFALAAAPARADTLSPLMRAAQSGNLERVKSLTWTGINMGSISLEIRFHGQPLSGRTALMFAAESGDVVKLLLERGADPDIQDTAGNTAFDYACEGGHQAAIEVLWPAMKKRSVAHVGYLLGGAAADGHLDIVQFLFDKSDDNGRSRVLAHATSPEHLEIMEFLLKAGVSITPEAMNRAARYIGDARALRKLLDHGADPNMLIDLQMGVASFLTPLMVAGRPGSTIRIRAAGILHARDIARIRC